MFWPLVVALLVVIMCMQGHAQRSIFTQALQILHTAKQSQLSAPAHKECPATPVSCNGAVPRPRWQP